MRMLCSATQGNSSPEEHATYVWKHIVEDCAAREIYVVAHSYGGVVTTHLVGLSLSRCITITLPMCVLCVLQAEVCESFKQRVKKIAFTDSVHNFELQVTSHSVRTWMAKVSFTE